MEDKTIQTNFTHYRLSTEAAESIVEQLNTGDIPVIAGDEKTLTERADNSLDNIVGFVKANSAKIVEDDNVLNVEYKITFTESSPMFNIVKTLVEEAKADLKYSVAVMGVLSDDDPPILEGDSATLTRVNCYLV